MKLSEYCDSLANAIDEANGDVDLEGYINYITNTLDIENNKLIDEFTKLYKCTPLVYAANAKEDSDWNVEFQELDNYDDDANDYVDVPVNKFDDTEY